MTDLYETLCVVRTAIVNSIGEMTLTGKIVNYSGLLSEIADEIGEHIDFIEAVDKMTENELFDLGFNYLDGESDLMLFPLWLYKFIPYDTQLYNIEGKPFLVGEDEFQIYSNNWVNAGILRW